MSESGGVKVWWADLLTADELDEYEYTVGNLMKEHPRQGPLDWQSRLFQVVPKSDFDKLQSENQRLRRELEAEDHFTLLDKVRNLKQNYACMFNENIENRAEIERLKTELAFTKEYLNPADTSFREMIDAFRVLPKEKQDKLIELSKALVGVQSGGG